MRKTFKRAVACTMSAALILTSTGVSKNAQAKAKVKLGLNKTSVSLKVGGASTTLKVTGVKSVKKVKKIVWSVANGKIASVTKKGVVKAKKAGSTTVTASVRYIAKKSKKVKTKKLSCIVSVKKKKVKATPTPVVTEAPTETPIATPTIEPTPEITAVPTEEPTNVPTATPVITPVPTIAPIITPVPTVAPAPNPVPSQGGSTIPVVVVTPAPAPAPVATATPTPTPEPAKTETPKETKAPVETEKPAETETVKLNDKIYNATYTVTSVDDTATAADEWKYSVSDDAADIINEAVSFGIWDENATGMVVNFEKLQKFAKDMKNPQLQLQISSKGYGTNINTMSSTTQSAGYVGWKNDMKLDMKKDITDIFGYGIALGADNMNEDGIKVTISLCDAAALPTVDMSKVPESEITLTKGQTTKISAPVTLPVEGRTPVFDGWAYLDGKYTPLEGITCGYDADTQEFTIAVDEDCAVVASENTKIYLGLSFDIDGFTYKLDGKNILIKEIKEKAAEIPEETPAPEQTKEPQETPAPTETPEPTQAPVVTEKVYKAVYSVTKVDNLATEESEWNYTVAEGASEDIKNAVSFGKFKTDETTNITGIAIDISKLEEICNQMEKPELEIAIQNGNQIYKATQGLDGTLEWKAWSNNYHVELDDVSAYVGEVSNAGTITIALRDKAFLPQVDISNIPNTVTLTKGQPIKISVPVTYPLTEKELQLSTNIHNNSWAALEGITCTYDNEKQEMVITAASDCDVDVANGAVIKVEIAFDIDGDYYQVIDKDINITEIKSEDTTPASGDTTGETSVAYAEVNYDNDNGKIASWANNLTIPVSAFSSLGIKESEISDYALFITCSALQSDDGTTPAWSSLKVMKGSWGASDVSGGANLSSASKTFAFSLDDSWKNIFTSGMVIQGANISIDKIYISKKNNLYSNSEGFVAAGEENVTIDKTKLPSDFKAENLTKYKMLLTYKTTDDNNKYSGGVQVYSGGNTVINWLSLGFNQDFGTIIVDVDSAFATVIDNGMVIKGNNFTLSSVDLILAENLQ